MAPTATNGKRDAAGLSSRGRAGVAGRESRRLALLKRCGLFGADTRGAQITRACTPQELSQAYRLVHDTFVSAGYMRPRACGTRIRAFEATAATATFVAKAGGEVVGVQTIVMDSPDLGLPSDTSFKRELDSLRSKGIRLCEATNEAVSPAFRKTAVATELMRCAAAQSFSANCDITVTTVSPSHSRFYSLLGFYQIGDIRSYTSDLEDPVVMMCLDMNELQREDPTLGACQSFVRDYLSFKNPYIHRVKAWQPVAHRFFHEPEFLRELFVVGSDLFEQCSEAQYEAIRRCWGDELFAKVLGARRIERKHWASRYIPVRPAPDKKGKQDRQIGRVSTGSGEPRGS